ncbi:hypothetical protein K435DRAFT_834807 [Dendrothele bispora CBS 962.96]|uniref:Uncharacterized protein n=1 Tax=Dendrothele bispora (strain CBS 962.96) TaxID=1314807 RepID=A0A4S8MR96_DENBC|nr:hypothetical protein K435DRAFT_834807 [Dendrothele bispora CBS 962.96]
MSEIPLTYWFSRETADKKKATNRQPRVKRKQIEDINEEGPPLKKSDKGKKVSTQLSSTKTYVPGSSGVHSAHAVNASQNVVATPPAAKYLTPKSLIRPKGFRGSVISPADRDFIDLTEDDQETYSASASESPSTSRTSGLQQIALPPTPCSPHRFSSSSAFHTPHCGRTASIVPETPEGSPAKGDRNSPTRQRLTSELEDISSQIPTSQSQDVDACWPTPTKRRPGIVPLPSAKPVSQTGSSQSFVPSSQSQEILCEATPKRARRPPPSDVEGHTDAVLASPSQTETDFSFAQLTRALNNARPIIPSPTITDCQRMEDGAPSSQSRENLESSNHNNDVDVVPTSQSQSEGELLDVSFISTRPTTPPASSGNSRAIRQALPDFMCQTTLTFYAYSPSHQVSLSSQALERTDSNASFIVPIEDVDIFNLFEDGEPLNGDHPPAKPDPPISGKPPSQSVTESDSDDDWRALAKCNITNPPVQSERVLADTRTESDAMQTTPRRQLLSKPPFSQTQSQTQSDSDLEPLSVPSTQTDGDVSRCSSVSSMYTLPEAAKDFLDLFDRSQC